MHVCPYHYSSMHAKYPKTINYFYDRNLFYARKLFFCGIFHAETFWSVFSHLVSSLSQKFTHKQFLEAFKIMQKFNAKAMRV